MGIPVCPDLAVTRLRATNTQNMHNNDNLNTGNYDEVYQSIFRNELAKIFLTEKLWFT